MSTADGLLYQISDMQCKIIETDHTLNFIEFLERCLYFQAFVLEMKFFFVFVINFLIIATEYPKKLHHDKVLKKRKLWFSLVQKMLFIVSNPQTSARGRGLETFLIDFKKFGVRVF